MKAGSLFRKLFSRHRGSEHSAQTILIVDDDEGLCDNLQDILEAEGYEAHSAGSCTEAVKLARDLRPCTALVDLRLPDRPGTALLSELKAMNPEMICILMTAYADVDSAVIALEKGAFYYLQKPIRPAELVELVELAFDKIRLEREKRVSEEELRARNRELEDTIARLRKIIEKSQT
jgi:DNA-binding NtrC family response regulator